MFMEGFKNSFYVTLRALQKLPKANISAFIVLSFRTHVRNLFFCGLLRSFTAFRMTSFAVVVILSVAEYLKK